MMLRLRNATGTAALLLAACGGGGDAGKPIFDSVAAQQAWGTAAIASGGGVTAGGGQLRVDTGDPSAPTVRYEVMGDGTASASVTYSNAQGGTEQQDVQLPWSFAFVGAPKQFLYISAQNRQEKGAVVVRIRLNGQDFRQSTSTAAFGVASASGTCC